MRNCIEVIFGSLVIGACYSPALTSGDGPTRDAGDAAAGLADGVVVADARADAACDDGDPCTADDAFTDGGCQGTGATAPFNCADAVVTAHDGSCYTFCPTSRTWAAGQADCAATGWTLVTIDDGVENNWVSTSFQVALWIGLFQDAVATEPAEGWTWVSGAPSPYRTWAISEPNNDNDVVDADCAFTSGQRWEDAPCASFVTHPILCELR